MPSIGTINMPSPVETHARGVQQGYGQRLSEMRAQEMKEKQMADQRKDMAQAARWVMSQPKENQEQAFNQALDFYAAQGENVDAFRGRMDVLPMIAQLDRGKQQFARKGFSPEFFQVETGELDAKGRPIMKTVGRGYDYDPSTGKYGMQEWDVEGTMLLSGGETPMQQTQRKIYEKSEGAKGEAIGKAEGEYSASDYMAAVEKKIAEAKEQARTSGKFVGEEQIKLGELEASLPALMETAEELTELAPLATYTKLGKFWDATVKESGFGSTEGSTARAQYQNLIDNQVLPLLKQTFGANPTDAEGQRLYNTLGDIDAPPETKSAQLKTFLDNKMREIQTQYRKLGQQAPTVEKIKEKAKGEASDQDKAALEWLENNPDSPQAEAVRKKLQSKGLL